MRDALKVMPPIHFYINYNKYLGHNNNIRQSVFSARKHYFSNYIQIYFKKLFYLPSLLISFCPGGILKGIVAYMLDCNIVISEFKH